MRLGGCRSSDLQTGTACSTTTASSHQTPSHLIDKRDLQQYLSMFSSGRTEVQSPNSALIRAIQIAFAKHRSQLFVNGSQDLLSSRQHWHGRRLQRDCICASSICSRGNKDIRQRLSHALAILSSLSFATSDVTPPSGRSPSLSPWRYSLIVTALSLNLQPHSFHFPRALCASGFWIER